MPVNKVIYDNRTLIDLTNDTVTEETLLEGYTAHSKDGTIINGTFKQTTSANTRLSDIEVMLIYGLDSYTRSGNLQNVLTNMYQQDNLVEENLFVDDTHFYQLTTSQIIDDDGNDCLYKELFYVSDGNAKMLGTRSSSVIEQTKNTDVFKIIMLTISDAYYNSILAGSPIDDHNVSERTYTETITTSQIEDPDYGIIDVVSKSYNVLSDA